MEKECRLFNLCKEISNVTMIEYMKYFVYLQPAAVMRKHNFALT
jgi:hypothetical protein